MSTANETQSPRERSVISIVAIIVLVGIALLLLFGIIDGPVRRCPAGSPWGG